MKPAVFARQKSRCPRCGGYLYRERVARDTVIKCLQCGRELKIEK